MKKSILSIMLMISSLTAYAFPDWLPGKISIEKSRISTWNAENFSSYKLDFHRVSVVGGGMKELIFSGLVRNSGFENIESWILDLRAVDKKTNSTVLSRRVRFTWSAPTSLNRNFENVKFWMPFGQSEFHKIAVSLGPSFAWNYTLVAAIPEKYKKYDVDKIFGVDGSENWVSHD